MSSIALRDLELGLDAAGIAAGLVLVKGCPIHPSTPEIDAALAAAIGRAKIRSGAEAKKAAVRDMLRHGRYKPTGRGKPACEYLQAAALEDRFPRINSLVDLLNLVSLDTLLPISVIDLQRAGTRQLSIRRGREGESYIFNSAGQVIELTDLLLLALLPEDRPVANPVKDSMSTKLTERSTDTLSVLYAPQSLQAELQAATLALAEAYQRLGGAQDVASATLI